MTIGAGQIIKMRSGGITVHGRMIAEGTASDPIMFASYRDDSIGGDTNGNGPSGPGDADWGDIEFTSTSTGSVLNHVELRSGSFRGSYHQLSVNGGELTLSNSVIRNGARGIQILNSDPVITNITLQNHKYEAVTMDLESNPTIRGFTAVGNGSNALVLFGDTLPANTTWDNPDVVYLPSAPITVPEGVTLTIDAGQVVKWGKVVDALTVQGTLVTRGTDEAPVVFTANVDDSIGGDSTGNGPSGGFSGAWGQIKLTETSTGSELDGLHLRYGGYGSNSHQLFVDGSELTLTNSVLFGGNRGLQVSNSDPTIRNVQFQNQKYNAARIDLMSNPDFENISFDNNATNGVEMLGGSLPADTNWDDPEVVYVMTGDITVPTGVTLNVAAGQIVKASGTTKVIVEGALQANGTIDEHVIFTSYWDDSAGGDSDNSGPTAGSQSDWQRIEIASGGNAILNGFEARYGGRGWDGPAALIFVNGGEATIKDSVIRESFVHGILVTNGTANLSNCLLVHNRVSGMEVIGTSQVIATNNTIDHSRNGVRLGGGDVTLTNNVITGPLDNSPTEKPAGILVFEGSSLVANFNDVYFAPFPNYSGISDLTGTDGNLSVDPKFFNAATLQYNLRGGSPVIDAGTSDGAPTADYFGNPRFDDPNVPNRGGGAMPFVDMGAIERQEISTSDIDLAVVKVEGPTTGNPDDRVTVTWTGRNVGTAVAQGPWRDAVYLSVDPVWTPDDVYLGEVTIDTAVQPSEEYSVSASVELPSVFPGEYYFLVRANWQHEVFEATALLNNRGASTNTIAMDIPELTLGVEERGTLDTSGSEKLFKVNVPSGESVSISLTGVEGVSQELYVKHGDAPTRYSFDARGIRPDSASQVVAVNSISPGTFYVLVRGVEVPETSAFTLTARLEELAISRITPARGSNAGHVTVSIEGSQFSFDSTVRLIDHAGTNIEPAMVFRTDSGLLSATFDLTGATPGFADIEIVQTGGTSTNSEDAFEIVTGNPGYLVTNLFVPSRVRVGREFDVIVEYANGGDTDILAPLLEVRTSELANLGFDRDVGGCTDCGANTSAWIVGVNSTQPAGILPPGSNNRVALHGFPVNVGNELVELRSAEFPGGSIDFEAIGPTIRPTGMSDSEWSSLYASIQESLGSDWTSYAHRIAERATDLTPSMGRNYSLIDVFDTEISYALSKVGNSVSGTLSTESSQPLGNTPIRFVNPESGAGDTTVSASNGEFLFPNLPVGTYAVEFDGFVAADPREVVVPDGGLSDLSLVASTAASIRGSVMRAASGIPVPDALVTVTDEAGNVFADTTGFAGQYEFNSLPSGTYDVSVSVDSFVTAKLNTGRLNAGDQQHNRNLILEKGGSIQGAVTGTSGPIEGVNVTVFDTEYNAITTTTSDTGQFTLTGVPPGTLSVIAATNGLAELEQMIQIGSGEIVTGVDFAMTTGGGVKGTVTLARDGSALEYGFVSIESPTRSFTTQADSEGNFELDGLPTGQYTVSVVATNFVQDELTVQVKAGEVSSIDVQLLDYGAIRGSAVEAATGNPLVGVSVFCSTSAGVVQTTVTDSNGHYEVADLSFGTYTVALGDINGPGLQSRETTVDENNSPTVDFSVSIAGRISGKVLAADGSTPNARAAVNLVSDGAMLTSTLSNEDGNYTFFLTQPGTYQVEVNTEEFGFIPQSNIELSAGTDIDGIDFQAGSRVISGVLLDAATGDPIQGGRIVVRSLDANLVAPSRIRAATDSSGNFQVIGLTTGTYRLTAGADHFGRTSVDIDVGAEDPAALSLELGPQTRLRGTIRDATTNQVIAEASVFLIDRTNSSIVGITISDADGEFEVFDVPVGDFEAIIVADGHETLITSVSVATGQQHDNIQLNPSTIQIRGKVTNGVFPLANVDISAVDPESRLLGTATTNSDGTFTLNSLPPGPISLTASAGGYFPSASIEMVASRHTTLVGQDFVLTPAVISAYPEPSSAAGFESHASMSMPSASTFAVESSLSAANATEAGFGDTGGWWSALLNKLKGLRRSDNQIKEEDLFGKLSNPNCREEAKRALALVRATENRYSDWEFVTNVITSPSTIIADIGPAVFQVTIAAGKIAQLYLDFKISAAKAGVQAFWKIADDVLAGAEALHSAGTNAQKLINDDESKLEDVVNNMNSLTTFLSGKAADFFAEEAKFKEEQYGSLDVEVTRSKTFETFMRTLGRMVKGLQAYEESKKAWEESTKAFARLAKQGDRFDAAQLAYIKAVVSSRHAVEALDKCLQDKPGSIKPPGSRQRDSDGVGIGSANDPNDKIGPSAFDAVGFIQDGTLNYEIQFENDPNVGATLPAQEVFVTDTLDKDLNLADVEFTGFGFSNFNLDVPPGLSYYETVIDLRPHGIDLLVAVTLDVKVETRDLSATFRSLDPLTGLAPDSIDAGFLPVNDKQLHNGEGYFRYRVRPMPDLPTGTEIRNQASIVFDINEPILTPETLHTIDRVAPTSSVSALDDIVRTAEFTVSWSGEDDENGSGIGAYNLYVSKDEGPFTMLLEETAATSHQFTGESGSRYAFASIARDNVGHVELKQLIAEAITTIILNAWVNHKNIYDVDDNGKVTAADALWIINELTDRVVHDPHTKLLLLERPAGYEDRYLDVEEDGMLTALDALRVINELANIIVPMDPSGEEILTPIDTLSFHLREKPEVALQIDDVASIDQTTNRKIASPSELLSDGVITLCIDEFSEKDLVRDSRQSPSSELDSSIELLASDVANQWAKLA
ncbi:carboxypeptidase regulatory-like domain-containing protein [Novipirellula artificiosorum]|uniref:carboxypeptidase regulatory-like domain-containing protein n=1 Tax=Novipirellula artificiosorum TaxID=2528016 RepID=UPI0011B4EF52|nr:carboxypeptidase regulatory-like domain-containing protein [Novipirellula artificiosorum]